MRLSSKRSPPGVDAIQFSEAIDAEGADRVREGLRTRP
jgi:hypothetical protein